MAKKPTKKLRAGKSLKPQKTLDVNGTVSGLSGKPWVVDRLAANHNEMLLRG